MGGFCAKKPRPVENRPGRAEKHSGSGLGGMETDMGMSISRHNGKSKIKIYETQNRNPARSDHTAIAVLCGIYGFARHVQKLKWADNADWFVTAPIFLLGGIMLTIFIFTLAARQNKK